MPICGPESRAGQDESKVLEKTWNWSSYLATAGKAKPAPDELTTDWVLGQFSGKRGKAEQEYRQFVTWGIGKQIVWTEVRGQTIFGEEDFADRFVDHLRKNKEIPEITRSQKYRKRPALEKLFPDDILRTKRRRNRRIADAVERHGYLQREIADHLGLNYATVESLEASDNLPDPDVIAQEIVEDLEAALEQFREIVGDLGEKSASSYKE